MTEETKRKRFCPASRDDKLKAAVRAFFVDGEGDLYEFNHVVQRAIHSIALTDIGLTTNAIGALRKSSLYTVGDVLDMSYIVMAALPGMKLHAGHVQEALAVYRRTYAVEPVEQEECS